MRCTKTTPTEKKLYQLMEYCRYRLLLTRRILRVAQLCFTLKLLLREIKRLKMKPKITLLTCTHNGERTIQQSLEAIANQTDVSREVFEVLVVDNASSDKTFQLSTKTLCRLNLNGRVLKEPKVGKINAFIKGIYEAKGDLVSIIDDDNFIEPEFIRYTLDIFNRYADVGMVGSANTIFVGQPLPPWFNWVKGRYACAKPTFEVEEICDEEEVIIGRGGIIAGAGSTFRVKPVRDCLERGYRFFNDARREGMKVSGEDIELCWLISSLGYRFAFNPRIQLRHAIKPDRLELKNFEILCKTIGAGYLGIDPFMFTQTHDAKQGWPLKWTWQWQLMSKVKRYIKFLISPENIGATVEERQFRNWISRVECLGAIQRILAERKNYTQHIRQVAAGMWTELRIR